MTDAPPQLGEFEGRIVTKVTIAVTNAGDGLSQKMKIDPVALHQGDRVYVVLECEVGKVTFDPYDDGVCARVQTLKAGTATIMDSDVVKDAINQQADKNELAKEAEKGIQRISFLDHAKDHDDGQHTGDVFPVEGCEECQKEVDAVAAEAAADVPPDGPEPKGAPIGGRRRK